MKHKRLTMLQFRNELNSMEENKLRIQSIDVVGHQDSTALNLESIKWALINDHAKWLSEIHSWMFRAEDEEGNALMAPTGYGSPHDPNNSMPDEFIEEHKNYQESVDRMIFPEAYWIDIPNDANIENQECWIGHVKVGGTVINGMVFEFFYDNLEDLIKELPKQD